MNYKLLVSIIILAFAVRAVFIGTYFTGDSIDTIGPARNYVEIGRAAVFATNDNYTKFSYTDDGLYFNFTHPPMKTLLYSLWASLFGFSNTVIVILPIIFGLLSILFIYLLGKGLYSEKTGLIAAAIAAVIRYHFYASTITFGDNFLMLAITASIYFLIMYLDTTKKPYLAYFSVLTVFGFMTKFSIFAMIPVFFAVCHLYRNKIRFKASVTAIILITLVSISAVYLSFPITEYFTGVSNKEYNFFDSYMNTFLAARVGNQPLLQEKAFYSLSFAWQSTPFFAALTLLALLGLKRDKSYWIMTSWLAITFLIGFASSGQDFQRLMVISITPAIILGAKYVSDIDFYNSRVAFAAAFILVLLLAVLTGLNDMLPYYNPEIVGLFFVLAAVFAFAPQRKQLLFGASVGLSIFFLIGTNFLVPISSSAVQQLVGSVEERGYPYKELWTERDISLYLAPDNEPSFLQRPELNEEFIRGNNVRYIAFYSIYEEGKIIDTSTLCGDEPFFAIVNGRKVGLACEISAGAPK